MVWFPQYQGYQEEVRKMLIEIEMSLSNESWRIIFLLMGQTGFPNVRLFCSLPDT